MKKMATPLRKDIQQGKALKKTKESTLPVTEGEPVERKILTAKRRYSQRDHQEDIRLVTLTASSSKV